MLRMRTWFSARRRGDAGFTLMELVISVALLGVIMVALTGVVISYLRTTVNAQARLTESHDVQFAAAYWQRDVASVGIRSTVYNPDPAIHTYPLEQSVAKGDDLGVPVACSLPTGSTKLVTLGWTEYAADDPENPLRVTVTYVSAGASRPYSLIRVRCTAGVVDSTVTIADNLFERPIIGCPGPSDGCSGSGSAVPSIITMRLTSYDPENDDGTTYTATLTGERRQT